MARMGNYALMRERMRLPGSKTVCAVVLVLGGLALVVMSLPGLGGMSLPGLGGATVSDAAGPIVVGPTLVGIAGLLVGPSVRGRYDRWRDVRHGLRQIEMVLRLEAALSARRVPVTAVSPGCPRCGAPVAPDGPVCQCPQR